MCIRDRLGHVLAPSDEPHRQFLVLDPPLQLGPQRPLPRDGDERDGVEVPPGSGRVQQDVVAAPAVEGTDGQQQRASGGTEFGAELVPPLVALVVRQGSLRLGAVERGGGSVPAGQRHGREPGVPCPRAACPVDQVGGGAEDHGGRPHHAPLQQPQQMRPGALRPGPVVPGDHQRGAAPAEREHGTEGGVQPVGVHQVGIGTGRPERGHGGRVAAARDVHMVGADPGEVVGAVGLDGGAHRDSHAPGDEPLGQGADVRTAADVAPTQHLHGAQRRLAVRCVAAHGAHGAGAPDSARAVTEKRTEGSGRRGAEGRTARLPRGLRSTRRPPRVLCQACQDVRPFREIRGGAQRGGPEQCAGARHPQG